MAGSLFSLVELDWGFNHSLGSANGVCVIGKLCSWEFGSLGYSFGK